MPFTICTRGCTVARGLNWLYGLSNGFNHFFAAPLVPWPHDPVPRRLGAGGALTVLRFGPVRGCVRVLVFTPLKSVCARFEAQGCRL
jgi:hypothetical protein